MALAVSLHVLFVVIWVGGMFFAYSALRPIAASQLEPPVRLALWVGVFGRFFPWVWVSVLTVVGSGYWMIFAAFGGMKGVGPHIHAMSGLGLLMTVIFLFVFFVPYRRLKAAVSAQDWPAGGNALGTIRGLIGLNTVLGLATVVVGAGGRLFPIG